VVGSYADVVESVDRVKLVQALNRSPTWSSPSTGSSSCRR
jgi:hypothetical protein